MADQKDRTRRFLHESLQDGKSIEEYLQALATGFAAGVITFSDKSGEFTLKPQGLVHFEVTATRKRDRVRLGLDFSWKVRDVAELEEAGPLRILAEEQDDAEAAPGDDEAPQSAGA